MPAVPSFCLIPASILPNSELLCTSTYCDEKTLFSFYALTKSGIFQGYFVVNLESVELCIYFVVIWSDSLNNRLSVFLTAGVWAYIRETPPLSLAQTHGYYLLLYNYTIVVVSQSTARETREIKLCQFGVCGYFLKDCTSDSLWLYLDFMLYACCLGNLTFTAQYPALRTFTV